MAISKVTPISPEKAQRVIADQLREIQGRVSDTFCTLSCAWTALDKAEDDDDKELWSRAGQTVRVCCEQLESIRESIDRVTDQAAYWPNLSAQVTNNG